MSLSTACFASRCGFAIWSFYCAYYCFQTTKLEQWLNIASHKSRHIRSYQSHKILLDAFCNVVLMTFRSVPFSCATRIIDKVSIHTIGVLKVWFTNRHWTDQVSSSNFSRCWLRILRFFFQTECFTVFRGERKSKSFTQIF